MNHLLLQGDMARQVWNYSVNKMGISMQFLKQYQYYWWRNGSNRNAGGWLFFVLPGVYVGNYGNSEIMQDMMTFKCKDSLL